MPRIDGKYFMNLQEAVGWLLANNALPFQTTDVFVADTQLAKSNIINPSPIDIKVGSLVLFADCKVGTVSGIGDNYYIVGPDYTDIKDATVSITNISVNASGNLIVELSDGDTIDAGKIKQIQSFTINASQHLIAVFNDGTTNDLGAIFSGNISISGTLDVSGAINGIINGHNINTDGSLIARVMRPTDANVSWDLNFFTGVTGLSLTEIFSKAKIIAGVLHVIVQFKIVNTTESALSLYQFATSDSIEVLSPTYADAIYDLKNQKVSDAIASECTICKVPAILLPDTSPSSAISTSDCVLSVVNATAANYFKVICRANGYSLPAGATRYITTRVSLTLV